MNITDRIIGTVLALLVVSILYVGLSAMSQLQRVDLSKDVVSPICGDICHAKGSKQ